MTIEPDFLDELDRFTAALNRQTSSIRQGDQQSPQVGEGLTFSDYRRYSPGDDTRRIDWKLFARTEEYFIKQYEEERSLTVHLLVDVSASMDYGDASSHKFKHAAKLGLGFAYLISEENNEFRFCTFRDRVDRIDTGQSNRGEILSLIDQLNEVTPEGKADFESSVQAYAKRIRSRSLVVVFSDCLTDPEELEAAIGAIARNDADVLLARVVAPAERDPGVVGDVLFADPESDAERRSYFSGSLAETYRSRLDAHIDSVSDRVTALGGDHILVDTGREYFDSFASIWLQ